MTMAGSWKWCCGACRSPVAPSTHELKYSLFYGRPGIREVGYEHERGKGDHRHVGGAENGIAFTTGSSS